ncbi:hypothetical protein CONLIGDRAFT_678036 [Coniochaeta ligniaria NRRL 30616]|uniref:C2H2-type domain-containing protein n=1 Tax=Coniochaeta ligniaria NRRL 30616 TaxID=1408157 RepID=A0A1J7IVQ3_9PEZI|nr:hypothetical protein CONLIGDRAFT_678036 [Coniochaeta ligniaria NRRL 30616]
MEDPVFQPHVFDGHFNAVIGSYIDPSLQPSPSDPYLSQWEREPPQVKRWISDDQRTYFNADPYSNVVTSVARPSVGTRPVPSQVRFPSPISSSDHGLTAPSPLAETESFYDNNLPSTPSDTAVLSPSYHPVHFEYYSSQEEAIQFVNMGPAAPPAYVKPGDVDPSQQLGYCDAEATQPDFSLEDRSYSFGSGTSHNDVDTTHNHDQITVAFTHQRVSSPEEMRPIKAEREASAQYPPPPDHGDDDDASEAPQERPCSKRKKDDDDHDYTPGKKIKSSGSTSPRRTRPKPVPTKPSSPKGHPAASSSSTSQKAANTSAATKGKVFSCRHCKHTTFKDETSLETHIKKQHTRPFKCVFHFAGCTSTFASKNEWKRHNSTQHLVLQQWLCREGQCSKAVNGSPAASSSSRPPKPRDQSAGESALYSNTFNPPSAAGAGAAPVLASSTPPQAAGVRFNRKDLYTQHVRRMHMPPNIKKDLKTLDQQKAASQQAAAAGKGGGRKAGGPQSQSQEERTKRAWEEHLKHRQEGALRNRIVLPNYMRCPAVGCQAEFRGGDAWDQRMEHVAKHLESGDRGEVNFGGVEDGGLVEWAASPAVGVIVREGGGWALVNKQNRGGSAKKEREEEGGEIVVDDGERDAECEEDDDVDV